MPENNEVSVEAFNGASVEYTYAAFLDVLGFSSRILADFDGTVALYTGLIKSWKFHYQFKPQVPLTIYSDALLLTTPELGHLVGAVNTLHMVTTMHNCLLRGGIGYGRHLEARENANIYVVSEALTRAAILERKVSHPCVAFDASVTIPTEWWTGYPSNLLRPVLFFDGLNIVNPFNQYWYQSAAVRVAELSIDFPKHRASSIGSRIFISPFRTLPRSCR